MSYLQLGEEDGEGEVAVRFEGAARVENQRGAAGEGRDGPVVHHPGGGGEVQHPRGWGQGAVEVEFLLVLEEGAGCGVDYRLGEAGGAGRIKDVEGVGWG